MMKKNPVIRLVCGLLSAVMLSGFFHFNDDPEKFTNSLGMEMVRINPGSFMMGNNGEIDYSKVATDAIHASYIGKGGIHPYFDDGTRMEENPLEWDEGPAHKVTISQKYYMSSKPVTNIQYEQFDPDHVKIRGKRGFSSGDDEAVIYVNWEDALAFTKWLSEKEGKPYRLPTEAEWEYAARAGTTSPFFTGDSLPVEYHQHQVMNRSHTLVPENVNLTTGLTRPNDWGLFDMHGIVEEWCYDWYGPYSSGERVDPIGIADGIARVTRGGSHSTGIPFLRSASRTGAIPRTRSFLIGFRVAMGELPATKPEPVPDPPTWARNVSKDKLHLPEPGTLADMPVFKEPRTFTKIPKGTNGPLYFIHNHNPAVTALANGDLLAIWFSTVKERGREMVVAGSRLRWGNHEWDDADVFFHVPGRNLTGQALWWDGHETVYHFSGMGTGDHWRDLALVMRTSTDNGCSWSKPVIIWPEYGFRHQPIDAVMSTHDGKIVLVCDATYGASGGSAVHISNDNGKTWFDPGRNKPEPDFTASKKGAWIAGIHAGIAELNDGRWMALGRGNEIDGRMPMSISADQGESWSYHASPFSPIGSAQRLALVRLQEGALLLLSFDDDFPQLDKNGNEFNASGMFAALSFDEGRNWPVKKLITHAKNRRLLDAPCNIRWGEQFSILDRNRGESRGYLTATQSADGIIHVLSSGTHYSFNLPWLLELHPGL